MYNLHQNSYNGMEVSNCSAMIGQKCNIYRASKNIPLSSIVETSKH